MKVYLDHAATTFMYDEVIDEMAQTMKKYYGNPSSTHAFGVEAKALIENVRKKIAKSLHVKPNEIIFTSGGTEANNMVLRSCVDNLNIQRVITTPLEHKCILETSLEMYKNRGIDIRFLKTDSQGNIDLEELETILESDKKPTLVSLMHANNEIGNIYPIKEIAKICHSKENTFFHTDTVQTIAHYDLDFEDINMDFASCSAHKFNGPKGVGFAYIKKETGLKAVITGGGQERNLRSGTENIYGIVGLGKAFELSLNQLEKHQQYIKELKQYTIDTLKKNIPNIQFNGLSEDLEKSLYTVLNVFLPTQNELLGIQLNLKGIALSQGSACSSGANKGSSVISRIRSDEELLQYSPLRISFSFKNTKEEIDYLVETLKEIVINKAHV